MLMGTNIKTKTSYLIGLFLALFAGMFLWGHTNGRQKADRVLQAQISLQNATISRLTLTINNQKAYITEKEQEILTLKEAKEQGLVTNEALRKLNIKTLNELTKAKLTINIVRDSVKHNGKIITVHDTILKDIKCIELPFSFADSSQYVNLWGSFDTEGTMNYGLQVPISLDVYTGISKETHKPFADVVVDNPFVFVDKISSVKLDVPKVKKWGIGISAGYGAFLGNPVKTAPFVGISLNRNIIRF
jgi:hypothetical protein